MKKVISSGVMLFMATATVFAGGLVTNSNQSAAFMRNPARDAMTEVDAAYYNPAGVAFMSNGFHFGFNNQSAFQQRNITGTLLTNPAVPVEAMQNKEYKGTIVSPVIPSIDFVYVADRWSISSHLGVPGGGGACEYEDGLPMFDAMVRGAIFQKLAGSVGPTIAKNLAGAAAESSSFTGKTYLFGWQVGGAYKVTDNLSLAAGIRLGYYMANYTGEVRYNVLGTGQDSIYNLDCDQSGLGIAPILGVNYKTDRFSAAVKYEFGMNINAENDTKEFPKAFGSVASLSRFEDGKKSHADQPALLTIGAAYDFTPSLTVSAGFHYYFDKDADYNGLEKLVDNNTVEYLLGAEYKLNDKWIVSMGGQASIYDVTSDYNTNTGFMMSSYSLTGGFRYSINEKLAIDLGCMWTTYDDFEKTSTYGGVIPVKETYLRKNIVPAIGLIWDL